MNTSTLSLKAKLFSSTIVPVIALGAVVVGMIALAMAVHRDIAAAEHLALRAALLADGMQLDTVQVQQFLSDVSATRALDGLDDGFTEAASHRDQFLKKAAELRPIALQLDGPSSASELDDLQRNFVAYYEAGEVMARAYVKDGPSGGNPRMGAFDQAAARLTKSLDPIVARYSAHIHTSLESIAARITFLRNSVTLAGLVVIVMMLTIAYFTQRSIARPLGEVSEALDAGATQTTAAAPRNSSPTAPRSPKAPPNRPPASKVPTAASTSSPRSPKTMAPAPARPPL